MYVVLYVVFAFFLGFEGAGGVSDRAEGKFGEVLFDE